MGGLGGSGGSRVWVLNFVTEECQRGGACCEYSLNWIGQSPSSPALVSGSTFHVFILAGLGTKLGYRSSLSYLVR